VWHLRQHPKVLALPFVASIHRAQRDNAIDTYIGPNAAELLEDSAWQQAFTARPPLLTPQEKQDFLAQVCGVVLGSDAFFPFGDNIERAHKSGVCCIAQPGGSIRDDDVIETCNKYNIVMAFTGLRLFFH
jgi:AICAR transformylase/IMP cyclohydrolase PurH